MDRRWSLFWVLFVAVVGLVVVVGCTDGGSPAVQEGSSAAGSAASSAAEPAQGGSSASGAAAGDSKVIARVGDKVITEADLQKKLEEIPSYARKNFLTKEGKLKLLDNMLKSEMLYQAALDAGYDQREDIKEKLEDARKRILQSEYFKEEIKDRGGADLEEMKAYYEEHKQEYTRPARAKVAHILLESEDQARKVLGELRGGADFAELAAKYSQDTTTKATGGELGWITAGGFIRNLGKSEEFEKAAFALKPGEVSEPVKTLKGWHLIKLLEFEPESVKPFEEVKAEIANALLVTEDDIRREYEENKDSYKTRARVKAKHIQFSTREAAEVARKRLLAGEDFDTLARELSEDKATARNGGELGYIYEDGYIRGIGKDGGFERTAFELDVGGISEVVKTKKGYHVITITEKDESRQKTLDEVRSQIRNKLMRDAKERAIEKAFERLKERYNVKVFEDRITDSPGAAADAGGGAGDHP